MRLLDRKEKNAVTLNIDGGREYIAVENKKEREYLRFVAHLLSTDSLKFVYKLQPGHYLFVERNDDKIVVEPREIDDSEARVEIGSFFGGRLAKVIDEAEVPKIKQALFEDKKALLLIVIVAGVIFSYVFPTSHPKKLVTVSAAPSAPAPLSDAEKVKLKVIAGRMVAERIAQIVTAVQSDRYRFVYLKSYPKKLAIKRIASISAQLSESPQSISYGINTAEESLYPETDAISKERGIWAKTLTDTISVERKDIKPVTTEGFDTCAMQMLNSGFYVMERKSATGCAYLTYENDAMKSIGMLNSITDCNMVLNSISISGGKGKLDVALCK